MDREGCFGKRQCDRSTSCVAPRFRWLVLLSTFIVVAGTVLVLRRPGTPKLYHQEIATPRAERREKNTMILWWVARKNRTLPQLAVPNV